MLRFDIFLCFYLPISLGIVCNSCIENDLYPSDKPCSSCNGTTCFIYDYHFTYYQYKGMKAYEMGCLTTPEPLPIKCWKNQENYTMCTCHSSYNGGICKASSCCSVIPPAGQDSPIYSCIEPSIAMGSELVPLASFDLFAIHASLMWPTKNCLRLTVDDIYYDRTEVCITTSLYNQTKQHKANDTVICRSSTEDKDRLCKGHLCFVAESTTYPIYHLMGCIEQFDAEGIKLVPGLYDFYMSKLFICNTNMCNTNYTASGEFSVNWIAPPVVYTNNDNYDCCPRPTT